MPTVVLAFDRSARHIDADGRLHVDRTHISKAAVNPYYGREIPGYAELGLDGDKVYRLLRDPVELERGAETFARLPILSKHVPVTVDAPQSDLVVGSIGSDIVFASPYLDADICVWDASAIAGIESKKVRELSCSYRYVPVMEPGEFEGQAYDGRMTEIKGNHLALVEVGRAGPDVVVADHNPFKDRAMKMTKLGKALFAALCLASPVLAQDAAVPALLANADKKTLNRDEIKSKLFALDADLDPQKVDNLLDAVLGVEDEPKPVQTPSAGAADESPADKVRALLAGKVDEDIINQCVALCTPQATDEAPEDDKDKGMKKEDMEAAMDSMRVEFREANEARVEVRPVVGDVVAMDSAAEIYGFALDHMKVDRKGVEGAAALRALFRAAHAAKPAHTPAPVVAQDSAGMAARFPAAARFRHA